MSTTVTRYGTTHILVRPLDDEAAAETVWRVAPRRLCGTASTRYGVPCEVCLTGLASLLTYSRLVRRWRQEGRLVDRPTREFPPPRRTEKDTTTEGMQHERLAG